MLAVVLASGLQGLEKASGMTPGTWPGSRSDGRLASAAGANTGQGRASGLGRHPVLQGSGFRGGLELAA